MGSRRAAPLAGRRVVITRSRADNRLLAAELAKRGAVAIELALVDVLPPPDGGAGLQAALESLSDYRYVIVTSTNAVEVMVNALGDRPWPNTEVVPVGPVTEQAARDAGMTVVAPPSVATAQSLVDGFEPWDGVGGRRVLAPLAELASDVVERGLTAKGYVVDRITAYRTGAPDGAAELSAADRAAIGDADAITFYSPSAVDRFVELVGTACPPVVVCIGPSTAERAHHRELDGIILAEPHTTEGVMAALAGALASDSSDGD